MEQPLIQLIVLPNHTYSLAELESLAEEFYRVDVLLRKYDDSYRTIISKDLYVHIDLSESSVQQLINRYIDRDSDFYLVHNGEPKIQPNFAGKLRDRLNYHTLVMLVKSEDMSNLLVNTQLSISLCHNGSQTIEEKIDIFLRNMSRESYMFDSMSHFFDEWAVNNG